MINAKIYKGKYFEMVCGNCGCWILSPEIVKNCPKCMEGDLEVNDDELEVNIKENESAK